MPKRYFNWKLAIILLMGLAVLCVTALTLRQWQRSNRAEHGLTLGIKAYNEHRWEEAALNLGRYIAVERNDIPTLLKYAEAHLNIRPLKRSNVEQAVAVYRHILRIEQGNSEAALQLTELYLAINAPGEAELIARRFLKTNQNPKLRTILAMSLAKQRKFEEAATELKSITEEYPAEVLAYETLGLLTEQRPENLPAPASQWYDAAVKNNPSSALAYISRASFHLRNNDTGKALADLKLAEKSDLSDNTTRLRLAREFIYANALDKAEKHLLAVQKNLPTNQTLWQTWAQWALRSKSKEKMLNVAQTGLKELACEPWDFMPIAAELFIRSGQLDRATECISNLRQKDIAPQTVAFLEALVADRKNEPSEAVKCWHIAMESGNKSPAIRLALASALSRLGDTRSALRQLRTLVSETPNYLEGRLALVKLLAQTGNWAEVAEQAASVLRLSPKNPNFALLHIEAQIRLLPTYSTEENSRIVQDIKRQLSLLEKDTTIALEVKLLQLRLAMQQGNFAIAETLISQLNIEHPSEIKVAMAEAELLTYQKKDDQAISLLNKKVVEFPQATEPVRYLALLLARQNDYEKCEALIKAALTRVTQPAAQRDLSLLLANLYLYWGQQDNAYEFLNTVAGKLPNDILVKRQLLTCEQVIKDPQIAQQLINDIKNLEGEYGWQWRYEQAKLWFRSADFKNYYPQIIPLLQENLLANPDDQASRMLLATTYEKAGNLQVALSTYRQALNRSPQDIQIIVATVAALYKAKEYDQAQEILNRASQEKLYHPELQKLQLEGYLIQGQLSSASEILEDFLGNDPNNQNIRLSLALLKIQQNNFTEAAQLLDELKATDPNSLPVAAAQIRLNIRQNKPQEALKICNEMVNNFNNAPAYILRARTYASLGQADKTMEDLEQATTAEPNNAHAWLAKSDFYSSTGQLDKGIGYIRKAMALEPNNLTICKRAIALFLASNDSQTSQEGKKILDNTLTANPDDGDLQLLKARTFLAEGTAPAIEKANIEKAKQILQKITQEQSNISEAWMLLGEILLGQEQPGKAVDIALQGLVHTANDKGLLLLKARAEAARSPVLAIPTLKVLRELYPNDADTAVLLANTYIATDEPQKAVELLKAQLASYSVADSSGQRPSRSPDERKTNIALAVALHKNGSKAEAQKKLESLLQSAPDDPTTLLTQARLLKDDQMWDQLNQTIRDWYQKHPTDTYTPVTIARELAAAQDGPSKKTAEDILRMILNNDPNSIEAKNLLAMLLQTTGRFKEATELYQQILTVSPDDVIAINNLAWILCEEQGKYQEALQLAEKGLKIAPNYIDLIDTRGVVYYRLGEYNKAVQDFTECIKLYPSGTASGTASHFHLGRAFAELRQKDKAIEHLNQALSLQSQIGGLSTTEITEAQHLLEELSRGT